MLIKLYDFKLHYTLFIPHVNISSLTAFSLLEHFFMKETVPQHLQQGSYLQTSLFFRLIIYMFTCAQVLFRPLHCFSPLFASCLSFAIYSVPHSNLDTFFLHFSKGFFPKEKKSSEFLKYNYTTSSMLVYSMCGHYFWIIILLF